MDVYQLAKSMREYAGFDENNYQRLQKLCGISSPDLSVGELSTKEVWVDLGIKKGEIGCYFIRGRTEYPDHKLFEAVASEIAREHEVNFNPVELSPKGSSFTGPRGSPVEEIEAIIQRVITAQRKLDELITQDSINKDSQTSLQYTPL